MQFTAVKTHTSITRVQQHPSPSKHHITSRRQRYPTGSRIPSRTRDGRDTTFTQRLDTLHKRGHFVRHIRDEERNDIVDSIDVAPCFETGRRGMFNGIEGDTVGKVIASHEREKLDIAAFGGRSPLKRGEEGLAVFSGEGAVTAMN